MNQQISYVDTTNEVSKIKLHVRLHPHYHGSHCKYMENRKAKATVNLPSCDIADSFQGADKGSSKKPNQLMHYSADKA